MELIKGLLLVVGIFVLVYLSCVMLLKSEDSKRLHKKQYLENVEMIKETNEMLDETLTELESYNEPLKKVMDQIDKFNHRFLGK